MLPALVFSLVKLSVPCLVESFLAAEKATCLSVGHGNKLERDDQVRSGNI